MAIYSKRIENLVLAVVVLGTVMGAIDTTVVLLAFPSITASLNSNLATIIWTIMVYLLVVAVFTTQLGRLGDIYGREKAFNFGFVVFTIGSALCGFSPDALALIGFRVVQAFGASLMQANSGAIISDYFEPNKRGRAFGYTTMGWNIGAILGIVLGGVITTFIGWRYIFFINVPIGIIGVLLGLKYLKQKNATAGKIDFLGMAILAVLLTAISYGAVDIASSGQTALNEGLFLLGALLIPVFIYIEKKVKDPMINVRMFGNKALTYAISASFLQSLGFLSVVFLLILYLQGVRGLSPLDASLLLVPGYVIGGLLSPRMGRLSDKIGARTLATAGIVLIIAATLVYISMNATTSLYLVILGSIMAGFGGAMFWPSNISAVMANATRETYGAISGLSRALNNIGTVGSYAIAITAATLSISPQLAFQVFVGTTNLSGNLSTEFVGGIHAALFVSVLILICAGVLSWLRSGHTKQIYTQQPERQNA